MFDSHAHYDDARFDADRYSLLDSLFSNGTEYILNAASDIETSRSAALLAEKYSGIYCAAGVHPHEAESAPADYLSQLNVLLSYKKAVAIGEIGLDYHYDFSPRDKQKEVFRTQLELADRLAYPVIIHDREAHMDCMNIALEYKNVRGVFHSFSGSAESAEILQKADWYISFSGVVTFKNAKKAVEAAQSVADEYLLVETDCPYLTPHPFRGERNNTGYMRHTIDCLAEIRGQSFEYIEKITTENAKRLFAVK